METRKHKVIIVDDHKLFREGMKFVIEQMDNLEVIAEASNGDVFLKILDDYPDVDLVLMDISMPELNGVEATKRAIEKYPDLKILVLSMFGDEEYYYQMVHAGVLGFVLKQSGTTELEQAITCILEGDSYFSQKLLREIIVNINHPRQMKADNGNNSDTQLTRREKEVLELICEGLSNNEIAEKLYLSIRTVEGHKSNLISKTGVKNTIGLVMYALKNKLVDISNA